jgi:hypothetical protein
MLLPTVMKMANFKYVDFKYKLIYILYKNYNVFEGPGVVIM